MIYYSLGYSPCPNDTFIFYALVHGRIPSGDIMFREVLDDVETLNQMARRSELDITKVSYHALGHLTEHYCLLRAGGALGKGCGPLVIAREELQMKDLRGKTIAIPGLLTTAFLLLRIFDSSFGSAVAVMPFDRIVGAVRSGEVDAGLIIHESRFTYQKEGLRKVLDLGEWWEQTTGLPIPLGGILAKRELGEVTVRRVEDLVRKSIEYSRAHPQEPVSYIKRHAQELQDEVINQHIGLYVNDFSLDIGDEGVAAVEELFSRAEREGLIPRRTKPLFPS